MYIKVLLTYTFALSAVSLSAQCALSVGTNLFERGNFGTGIDNNLLIDPNISPGYNYVTDGPPMDGNYILTNNTGNWPLLFPTWLSIRDNSNDPNGYMMVVNASVEPGIFYEERIIDLCDNTTFEFSADIINLIRQGTADHIDPNVDFLIDGQVVLNTGDIPKNESWNIYSFEFSTAPRQTSVTLSLRNNAPGGTGNDLALDNITFRACGPSLLISSEQVVDFFVCQEVGEFELISLVNNEEDNSRAYVWETSSTPTNLDTWVPIPNSNSSRYAQSELEPGSLYYRVGTTETNANISNPKCIFYSAPFLVQVSQRIFEISDTICGGTPLPYGLEGVSKPGLYTLEEMSAQGCDSIVRIELDTISRRIIDATIETVDPACAGQASGVISANNISGGYQPYFIEINGIPYSDVEVRNLESGSHNVRVIDRHGCFLDESVILDAPPPLSIEIIGDTSVVLGEEARLNVISNLPLTQVIWEGLPDSIMNTELTFLPLINMNIQVIGITSDGCRDTSEILITVNTEARIYVPNIFSPNGDNRNDGYYVSPFGRSLGDFEFFDIYDRWGNKVWTTTDIEARWDGRYQGTDLAEGIYIYFLKAYLINGEPIEMKGSILLIR